MNAATSTTAADQLHADLTTIQNFVVAQRLREGEPGSTSSLISPAATTSEEGIDGSCASRIASPGTASPTSSNPPPPQRQRCAGEGQNLAYTQESASSDPLRELRGDLQSATAQLHAERAIVAQLRIQQRCDAAALQRLIENVDTVEHQLAAAAAERDAWKTKAEKLETYHADCTDHLRCMQEQVRVVQQRTQELEDAHRELIGAAASAQHTITQLTTENARLHDLAHRRSAELLRLGGVEIDLQAAQQRVRAFEEQHDQWMTALSTIEQFVQAAKAEYESGMQLVLAKREDYLAVQAALAQSVAQCERWERLFLTQGTAHTSDAVCADVSLIDATAAPEELLTSASPSMGNTAEEDAPADHPHEKKTTRDRDVFVQQLEAKVADLAVQLYTAQSRAEVAESHAQHLSQLNLVDIAVLSQLTAMVCAVRPQAEGLAACNAALEARLLATESLTEPLMEHVMAIAEAYTEEVCRQWQTRSLDAQLSGVSMSVRAGPSVGRDSAADDGRLPLTSAQVPGKRHRLRATALHPSFS